MATQLQNRIVGTVILVALAIIILPDLLDGQKTRQQQTFATTPLAPDINVPEQPVELPATGQRLAELPNVDDVAVTAEDAPTVDANERDSAERDAVEQLPEPQEATLAGDAWVIQLGVFKNAESVERLVVSLRAENYRAYAEPVQTDNGRLTKLMVGPDVSQQSLEAMLDDLRELTELDGKVMRYRTQ